MIGSGEIVFQSLEHRLVKKDDRITCQRFCIDINTALKIFKKTDQLVSFESNNARANIKIGIFNYEVEQDQNTIEEFNDLGKKHFSVTGESSICYFAPNNPLLRASKFVSNDELRIAMCHVRVDEKMVVATNAHYLWFEKHKSDVQEPFYVSPEVAKIVGDSDVTFKVPSQTEGKEFRSKVQCYSSGYEIIYRMPDAKYPDYNAVIPTEHDKKLTFGRVEMSKIIEGIIPFSNKTTYQGRLNLSEGKLSISTQDLDYNEKAEVDLTDIGASFSGDPIEIGFNLKFLLYCLKALEPSCVSLTMTTPKKACVIGETALLMPVMIGN